MTKKETYKISKEQGHLGGLKIEEAKNLFFVGKKIKITLYI